MLLVGLLLRFLLLLLLVLPAAEAGAAIQPLLGLLKDSGELIQTGLLIIACVCLSESLHGSIAWQCGSVRSPPCLCHGLGNGLKTEGIFRLDSFGLISTVYIPG